MLDSNVLLEPLTGTFNWDYKLIESNVVIYNVKIFFASSGGTWLNCIHWIP